MNSLANVPATIGTWVGILEQDVPLDHLAELLAPDAEFIFAGETVQGPAAVLQQLGHMPKLPKGAMELRLHPQSAGNLRWPRCIVPECGGVPFGRAIQQKLWDKYFTAAPAQLRQYDAVSSVVRKASKR